MTDNNEETTVQQSPEENNEPQAEEQAPESQSKFGGLLSKRNMIFGGAGLLVIILAVVGVMMFSGGGEESAEVDGETATEQHETTEEASHSEAHEEKQPAVEIHEEIPARKEQDQDHTPHKQEKAKATVQEHAEETYDELFADDNSPEGVSEFEMPDVPEDSGVMATIMENLEFLDYDPAMEDEASGEEHADMQEMSVEDSIAETNWIEEEKARLAAKEKELSERERKLTKLQKKIAQKTLYLERVESERIASLAKLYDNMDPRAVVQLMANLDDETVVSLIPRMKPKNASAVLQLMSSVRAARLSKQMISIAVSEDE